MVATLSESFSLVYEHEDVFVDAIFAAVLLAAVNVGANVVQNRQAHSAIKASAIVCLYFALRGFQGEGSGGKKMRMRIGHGFIFSFIGDVALLLNGYEDARWNELFFVSGLLSFLGGHIAFMSGFSNDFDPEYMPSYKVVGTLMVVALPSTIVLFIKTKGFIRFFVLMYTLSINAMVAMAVGFHEREDNMLVVIGAVLFTISDTLLGAGKFVLPKKYGVLVGRGPVMATYYCAQLFFALSVAHNYQPPRTTLSIPRMFN